jgi:hypothetical protein
VKTIRASEIGSFQFCRRAWWYKRQGFESQNLEALQSGLEIHNRHGRAVFTSGCLKTAAYLCLLLSIVVLAIVFTLQIV